MEASQHGRGRLGIPASVAREFVQADESDAPPKKSPFPKEGPIHRFLRYGKSGD